MDHPSIKRKKEGRKGSCMIKCLNHVFFLLTEVNLRGDGEWRKA